MCDQSEASDASEASDWSHIFATLSQPVGESLPRQHTDTKQSIHAYKPQHLIQGVCSVQVSLPVFAPVATASRHTPDPIIAAASSASMTGQPLLAEATALPNHNQEIHVAPALHPQQQKHQMKTPQMQSLVATAADARRNHSKARLSHSCGRTRRHRRSNSSCSQCPRTTQEWMRQP